MDPYQAQQVHPQQMLQHQMAHQQHQQQQRQQQPMIVRVGDLYCQTESPIASQLITRYIQREGVVVGWGLCKEGELGDRSRYNHLNPSMIGGLDKPMRVACSSLSSTWVGVRNVITTMGNGMWGELAVGNPRLHEHVIANENSMPIAPQQIKMEEAPVDPQDPVIDVVGGHSYFICVLQSGAIFAWGANNYGQCHHDLLYACCGLPQRRTVPNERVVEVACANFSVLARTASGAVYGWGLSRLLGSPSDLSAEMAKMSLQLMPVNVPDRYAVPHPVRIVYFDSRRITHVRGGPWHFAATEASGHVFTWGLGNNGRLGHGNESDQLEPKVVAALRGKRVIEVACGSFHTVFVTAEGEAYACGDNQAGQCGVPGAYAVTTPRRMHIVADRKVIHASCGLLHTHLLLETGETVAYGSGVGLGVGLGYGLRMVRCQPVMDNYTTFWLAGGKSHNFALTLSKMTCMLVLGVPHRGVAPTTRASPVNDGVIVGAVGTGFSLLISRRGHLYAFGLGGWGQLGSDISGSKDCTPEGVPVLTNVSRVNYFSRTVVNYVAAGYSFAMAITESNRVYAWGNNSYGQCGLGLVPKDYQRVPTPREVTWLADKEVMQLACGSYFAMALSSTGQVYTWGTLECCGIGQDPRPSVCPSNMILRDIDSERRSCVLSPVKVPDLEGIIQVAAGGWHALALNAIGEIFAWGVGNGGRLGLGDGEYAYVPTKIKHNAFFTRIGAGCYTNYGIDDDGKLYLWGVNEKAQLGEGPGKISTPTHVLDNVREVALGKYYTLALTYAGTFHFAGCMESDQGTVVSKGFHDTAGLPPQLRPDSLRQLGGYGIKLFGGLEHVIVLCDKSRLPPTDITEACKAMRSQPERIIARWK